MLTIPPAIVARMAVDRSISISGGRFGVNIVSGWHKMEYSQMGLWPGEAHFGKRYDYSTEYVRDHAASCGRRARPTSRASIFQMDDVQAVARARRPIKLVCGRAERRAAWSSRATYCDYNFTLGEGVNKPTKCAERAATA